MILTNIFEESLRFHTSDNVFSPSSIDRGTLAMLSTVTPTQEDKVLDLGCGYGIVGISIARAFNPALMILCDISEEAVALAKENALLNELPDLDVRLSNGFENISESDFTLILSNPPYHTDFSVAKHFIEMSYKRLAIGGRLVMVTKRLDWYKNKLTSVFGGVRVQEIDGYYVFTAEKRVRTKRPTPKPEPTLSKKLMRRYHKNK